MFFKSINNKLQPTRLGKILLAFIGYKEGIKRFLDNDPTYSKFLPKWIKKKYFDD